MRRADQRKFHYIYKITREDGKYYIGMHSTDDLDDGYFGSGQLLWKSIKKHGKEKHNKEILEFSSSRQELKIRERTLVNEEILNDPLCMNLKLGGEGGWDHITPEHQSKNGKRGNAKMRILRVSCEDWAKKTGTNISNGLKKSYASGIAKPSGFASVEGLREMTKRASSLKSIEKRKATYKLRGHSKGEKNSQFGRRWVTNGTTTIKVDQDKIDEYLQMGYSRGRKI